MHGLLFSVTRMGLVSAVVLLVPLCQAMLTQKIERTGLAGNSVSETKGHTRAVSEPLTLMSMSKTSISPD